jgi:hypothetical protein
VLIKINKRAEARCFVVKVIDQCTVVVPLSFAISLKRQRQRQRERDRGYTWVQKKRKEIA